MKRTEIALRKVFGHKNQEVRRMIWEEVCN